MKNKIYNIISKREINNNQFNKLQLKEIIESNSHELFGIKIIVNNYYYEQGNTDYIESIGIDENNQIVIFEYKIGKLTKTINKGFNQLDYIKKHGSQFKMLCNEHLGVENSKTIDYNPRLVVIGDHFHRYDYESIRLLPYVVELNEVSLFGNELLINRTYVNKQSDLAAFTIRLEGYDRDLFIELRNYIFALGEEIVEYGRNNVISYRRIFNFAFVYISNGVHLCVQGKDILIDDYDKIDQVKDWIEEEYDKN